MVKNIKGHNIVVSVLDRNSIVVDFGANKGDFADNVNKLNNSKVFSFEPFVDMFNQIPVRDGIIKTNAAISNTCGHAFLTINENSESNTLLYNEPAFGKYITVDLVNMDYVLKKVGNNKIDILKVDIEGTEIELFSNIGAAVIKKFGQITIEFHDFLKDGSVKKADVEAVVNKIRDAGFYVIKFSPRSNMDILFLNKDRFPFKTYLTCKYLYRYMYWTKLTILKIFG